MVKVLLISQGASFTMDSLAKSLHKEMIMTQKCLADPEEVKKNAVGTDVILLYGGTYIQNSILLFDYLKKLCEETHIHLGVIGYDSEINDVEYLVSEENISFKIKRPFDMKELVEAINKCAEENRAAEDSSEPDTVKAPVREKKHQILLCDDDIMFLKMMQDRLSSKYNVTAAKSGVQAISFISQHKTELILLDYEMPITSGPQVMEMIRSEENSKDIPIVFLTGKSDRDSVMSVMKLKPQGYLLKSTKKEDIIASIDNFFKTGTWKMIQT